MPAQDRLDILSSISAPNAIRYFVFGHIYFAESCLQCIAIKKQCIKVRDHRLQIKYFSNLFSKSKSNKVRKELKKVKYIIKFL